MQGYSLSTIYNTEKLETHQNQFLKGDYLEVTTTEFPKDKNYSRIHMYKRIKSIC